MKKLSRTEVAFQRCPQEILRGKYTEKLQETGEHPCPSVISLWHGCSPVNLLHIFRTVFLKNSSGGLLVSNTPLNIHGRFSKAFLFILNRYLSTGYET